jgi:hypothetical protein
MLWLYILAKQSNFSLSFLGKLIYGCSKPVAVKCICIKPADVPEPQIGPHQRNN